jgi:prepilin-type N-terminal cleavage/methylation domain-containing protein
MVRTTARPSRKPARRAFTLVELLVVIGIILLLVSLSVVAVTKALGYQQRRNTETAIAKLNQALQKQWLRVIDTAKNETPNANAVSLSNGDPRRAKVIHILMTLKREFPTTYSEATSSPFGMTPNQAYVRGLPSVVSGYGAEQQSSACLYLILKQARRGGDFDPDTSLSSQEVVTDSNGVKMINDGMGNPISLIRWPSGALTPSSTVGTLQPFASGNPPDKEDPEDLLDFSWWTWAQAQPAPIPSLASSLCSVTTQTYPYPLYPVSPTAGKQFQLMPVIISRGGDGVLGTSDDILSFQVTP